MSAYFDPKYREAPASEWTDGHGEVFQSIGQITITDNSISIERIHSQKFDRDFAADPTHLSALDDQSIEDLEEDEESRAKRGEVKYFSRSSQKRMMLAISSWQNRGQLTLWTLTYGRSWPSGVVCKEHFEKFRRMILRKWPSLCGLWKYEYQKRGAPHFHLVMEGCNSHEDLRLLQIDVEQMWQRATGSPTVLRTQVAFAVSKDHAKYYLAKEVGKTMQTHIDNLATEHFGRFWGWVNPSMISTRKIIYRLPAPRAFEVAKHLQHVIGAMMREQERIFQKDGKWFHVGSGAEFDPDKLQKWMLTHDPVAILKTVLGEDFEASSIVSFEVQTGPPVD